MLGIACTICTAVAPDAGPHRAHVRHELTERPDLVRRFPDRNPQNHRSTYLATLKIRNREPSQAEPTGEDITADRERSGQAAAAARLLGLPMTVTSRLNEGVRIPQERIDRTALADTSWWQPAEALRAAQGTVIIQE